MANGTTTAEQKGPGRAAHYLSGRETLAIGFFMVFTAVFLAYMLLEIWPGSRVTDGLVVWIGLTETSGLAIAMIAGALGAFVHIATSFASYAGNRTLTSSWVWWFLLRPTVGAALALMAYFIVRSGLLLDGGLGTNITPFGIAALSGIVGLASKQIVDKLRTVSDTAFNTENDVARIDKL